MGDQLFRRTAILTVDDVKIEMIPPDEFWRSDSPKPMLRFAFKISKSLSKEPNNCEVTVWNLNRTHRSDLAGKQKAVRVVLEAGYLKTAHQIFSGSMTFVQSVQTGNDWITKLQAGDGTDKVKSSRVNVGLKGPVTMEAAMKAAAAALGIPPGNLSEKTTLREKMTSFVNGLVLSGKADLQLDKLAKSFGLGWSIQDGQLQFLGPVETVGGQQIKLASGTGLVGSPQAGDKGVVKVRALLMPDLLPGRGVRLESAQVNGNFRIDKASFVGDTHGQEWYSDIELRPV
jgi:hypothetical protein